jgi:3-oxoadipate enol-lactonase
VSLSITLHCEDGGPPDGAPLLLAGSLGTTLRMWDPQVAALRAQGRRVVAYDQRGHGASPIPEGPYSLADLGGDALALMDRLGIERASFAGVSIGGMVGQWLAAHAPERIDRLVLLCTSSYLPPASAWEERIATVRAAGTVEAIADTVVARWVTPAFAAAEPAAFGALRAMLAACPVEGYAGCCAAIAGMDLRAEVRAVRAPTLVIGGAQDAAIPNEHQERLAAAIPGARLEILDPGAHVVSVERADAVTALIADHLDREQDA